MCEHINLRYHVPQLGEIKCWICKPYAANCFNLLNHYGHIKRMESIDQLGVIRNVFEGAHHPRWEYVILQLYIVNLLQDSKALEGNGIGSNVKLGDGIELSCAEVLQIWILLLNSGHLPGTFATEKALLKYSKKNNTFKRPLQEGLPKEMKEFFKKVLENENIYDVHKVLISFHLERYKRCRDYDVSGIKLVEILQKVLCFYTIDELFDDNKRKKQENLRSIFKRLRQISYLFLDSQYAPFPINFSLFQILNSGSWLKDLFTTPTKSISKTLDAFEDLLSINLYHSPYSIRELGYHSKKIEILLEKDEEEYLGITKLQEYLRKDSKFKPQKDFKWDLKPFNLLFDTKDYSTLKNFFKEYLTFEKEKQWNDKLGNNCQLTFQSSPTYHNVINLSLYKPSSESNNLKSVAKFLKFLVNLHLDSKNAIKSDRIDSIIQKPYEELLIDLLEYITNETLYFGFKDNALNKRIISVRGAINGKNEIEKIREDISLERSRKHEIEVLQAALEDINHRTELIISLSEILVYDKEKKHLTDIDGLAFGIKNNQLKILLIEAKKQKSSSLNDAKKQLRDNLSKFDIKTNEKIVINDLKEFGSVYCYLTINGL